eukprot:INCI7450.3.p1 GENE.INCI7450.3~~INCI7450.3.p1  ORF type:complete len:612 (+),score=105.15 INCI7450.3:303-2138(+)
MLLQPAATATATAVSKQFASIIFEICAEAANSSEAQAARKGPWRFVEDLVAGAEARDGAVGEAEAYDVEDLNRWQRACPHNNRNSRKINGDSNRSNSSSFWRPSAHIGRSLQLVCSSNVWTLESNLEADAALDTPSGRFFTAAESEPASILALTSLAKRQVATNLSHVGDASRNGSGPAATWSLCGQVGALPLQVGVEGDASRAALFALNLLVDNGDSSPGSDDSSKGDTRAARGGWDAGAVAAVVDQFRSGKCFLHFVNPDLQEACPLVVPRLVTKSEGNRSSAVELSAKRSAIQYIASASSSARETSQSSDPPGYIFFDNLYAQALQPIWAAPDPDPDPEENRADAGSGFETSGSPAVAKLRLKHVAERARLLFGRYVGDEVHDNAPREGHCVPVPHMHQIQRIHPLQEVRFLELGTSGLLLGGLATDPSGDAAPGGLGMMLGGGLASGIQSRVEANAGQFTDPNLVAEVTQMVRDRLTSQLSSALVDPLTDTLVAAVTEATVGSLQRSVAKRVTEALAVSISRQTDRLVEGGHGTGTWIRGRGHGSFQRRLGQKVGTALARRLMTSMTSLLAEALSHSIIPSLLHTVSHSPLQDYYCYYCYKHKAYCR